jgi:basic membrane protein A
MKRIVGCIIVIFAIVSCVKKEGDSNKSGGLKVGIVTTSGVDDNSFGQDCYNGILEFIKNNPEASVTSVKEPDVSKVLQAAEDVLADYDVLVLPGFQFSSIGAIMEENPDKKVILVDTTPVDSSGKEIELANIYAMLFHEEQSGFFAGVAAALETKKGKVAVVTGLPYPSVVNYQFGFMSGVNYSNKHFGTNAQIVELPSYAGTDVTGKPVGGNYIGSFADEATAKVIGSALIDQGVDVIFVAAGASGGGVFTAVMETNNVFVIGVDTDQYDDGRKGSGNIVLTSALKIMGKNVEKQLEAVKNGTFKGQNATLGVDSDSVGYVRTNGRQQLSNETIIKLDEVYELLKAGTITPASNFNGYTPTGFPGL